MHLPATKKPTVAVRCCPVLFELHKRGKVLAWMNLLDVRVG